MLIFFLLNIIKEWTNILGKYTTHYFALIYWTKVRYLFNILSLKSLLRSECTLISCFFLLWQHQKTIESWIRNTWVWILALHHLLAMSQNFNMHQNHVEGLLKPVSYTHLTLPTRRDSCRSRWSPYH